MTETTIKTFTKNTREDVVVRLANYHDVECIDVRVFSDFNNDGEKHPTKKGIAMKVTLLPELVSALHDAEVEARRRGLLT